jgi:organic hydroperoxide reductase OsmC/OhrA
MMLAGAAACFALRLLAMLRGWHLPIARSAQRQAPANAADRQRDDRGRR